MKRPDVRDRIRKGFFVRFTTHSKNRIERWMLDEKTVLSCLASAEPLVRKLQEDTKDATEQKWDAYYPYSKKHILRIVYVISEGAREARVITVHKINIKRQSRIVGE